MTRLEKAARAAAVAVGDDPDREGEPITAYIDLARAVLMAVRDGWLEVYHSTEGQRLPNYEQAEGFPAMIDAILNEGQP